MPPKKLMACAVRGCESKPVDITTITSHRFPLEVQEAAEWVRFSKCAYAAEQFKLAGPVGVRKLWMCSQHFEPSCYKIPETKTNLKYGALPTVNEPSEELEVDSIKNAAGEPSEDTDETTTTDGEQEDGSSPGSAQRRSSRKRKKHALDRFYDFLMDDDDDLDEEEVKLPKVDKPAPAKRKVRNQHDKFCVCNSCRKARSNAMQQAINPNKSVQTYDSGPQPLASPIPIGVSQDSCRLCFNTDQLEPLCSGMIVVRDEMLDKIYVCTGILIIPRPKESIFVCTPCAQLINSFHSYRQQVCSNNRALLRSMAWKSTETSPLAKVRKVAPPITPLVRKLPPGLTVTPVAKKPPARLPPRLPPVTQYRKIAPKMQVVIQPEAPIVPVVQIKTELEDPLGGCEEPVLKFPPVISSKKPTIAVPRPVVKKEPESETGLLMEAEDGREELPEEESWKCWHCESSFPFQFECAKHLLHVHGENAGHIKQRMKLNELNANMLEMMSVHQRK